MRLTAILVIVIYLTIRSCDSAHADEQPIPKGPYYLLNWTLNARTGEPIGIPKIEAGPFDDVNDCRAKQAGLPAENVIITSEPPQVHTHECGISHIDKSS